VPLYPYQAKAVGKLREVLRREKSCFLVAPTGAGKTAMAGEIMRCAYGLGRRVLVIAHRIELIDGMCKRLEREGILDFGVIMADHPRTDYKKQVQVASIQTLVRRLDKIAGIPFDLIIIDEGHHAAAETYREALAAWPSSKVILLTATPYRVDGKPLGNVSTHQVVAATTLELIEWGYLVPPILFEAQAPNELKTVRKVLGDYNQSALAKVMDQPKITGDVVKAYLDHCQGRRALAFAITKDHARHLSECFTSAGVRAASVDDSTPKELRAELFQRIRFGDLDVLCNVGIATEGVDLPEVSAIIGARPTKSRSLWRQMLGRGARTLIDQSGRWITDQSGRPIKSNFVIIDACNWTKEHGHFTDPDFYTLRDGLCVTGDGADGSCPTYECPACMAKLRSLPPSCPSCGHTLREKESIPTHADGIFKRVDSHLTERLEQRAFAAFLSRERELVGASQ
jgi:superfamily II DNA or RNA helicase